MTQWPQHAIGEIVDHTGGLVQTGPFGSQLHRSDYTNGDGVALVMPKDMVGGRIDYSSTAMVNPQKAAEMRRHACEPLDVLLARRGDIGRCVLVRDDDAGVLCGTGSIRISVKGSALIPEFLFYFLSSDRGREELEARSVGATMANLSAGAVRLVKVPTPSLNTQRKIASALSNYDDLIDINRRRIERIEEIAQRIYREWFVDFRYPGYDRVPLVDSELGRIPRGWDVVPFTDLAQVLSGGTPRTTEPENWGGTIPFFTPRDARPPLVVMSTEKKLTERGLAKCNSPLYPVGTVFITARGTVGKVAIAGVPMAMNQSCYALAGIDRGQEYILFALLAQVEYLKTNTGGATFDTVIVDTFRRMRVASPPVEIVRQFCALVAPVLADLTVLIRSTHNLRETRDLLLPRLMSGQIDVEELDIIVGEAAA